MTALTIAATRPEIDTRAIAADIREVLAAHGLGGADYIDVKVSRLVQAGHDVGVSLSGSVWSKPPADTAPPALEVLPGGVA